MLKGKKILLGVCGSIAAYKTAILIRLLKKQGAEVQVIMTASALDFITPLTLATLSKKPVLHHFYEKNTGEWQSHVALGLWADLFLIAPASANTLAKMANGVCYNLMLATYFSARCPVFVAPAMDLDMYQHPSTQHNIKKLISYGNHLIDAEHGELASGLTGDGRMAEPGNILRALETHFKKKRGLEGKKVLITAGPTYESIDPVRFIGNHSTGKMGYALAEEMAEEGAEVILVSGPSVQTVHHRSIKKINVTSAREMYESSLTIHPETDIAIFSAAVADYGPANPSEKKIKKTDQEITITLKKNPDIAFELGKIKTKGQFHIGFALETDQEVENARSKLKKKNLDFIVLNSLKNEGAGFAHPTNRITIINKDNQQRDYPLKSKREVAKDIVDYLLKSIHD